MLTTCPDCKNDVSDQAVECPRCAYPFRKPRGDGSTLRQLALLAFVLAAALLAFGLTTRAPIGAYYAQRLGLLCALLFPVLALWGWARR